MHTAKSLHWKMKVEISNKEDAWRKTMQDINAAKNDYTDAIREFRGKQKTQHQVEQISASTSDAWTKISRLKKVIRRHHNRTST